MKNGNPVCHKNSRHLPWHLGTTIRIFLLVSFTASGILLLTRLTLYAQVYQASLAGTVGDQSGGVIAGAKIIATHTATGREYSVSTDSNGSYVLEFLPSGEYAVSAEFGGFKREVRTGISLQIGQRGRLDFTLHLGEVTETVEVSGGAPLVQTEDASLGEVIDNKKVNELPLNGRNYVQLAQLVPGAVAGPGGQTGGSANFEHRPYTVSLNGNREFLTMYTVDTVDSREPWDMTPSLIPPIDAIQEFKVQTNYSAEVGSSPGAQVNVAVKSGSNKYHGTLYEFHRDAALNARNFFDANTPPFTQNQFGGSVGGPIKKDETFFFANFERFTIRRGLTLTDEVPTDAFRAGDFSSLGTPILDPQNSFQPFPNNQIPSNRISEFAKIVMPYWPSPNRAESPNFGTSGSYTDDTNNYVGRIDHNISQKDRIFGRYILFDENFSSPTSVSVFRSTNPLRDQGVTLQETHIFSQNTLNEFRYGYLRHKRLIDSSTRFPQVADQLNIPGVDTDPAVKGFPTVAVVGFAGLGEQPYTPLINFTEVNQFADTLSLTRGRHTIKPGIDIKRYRMDAGFALYNRGEFDFDGRFTSNPFADFLLGYPSLGYTSIGLPLGRGRYTYYNAFLQDDWKVSPRLSINIGIRYEYNGPWEDQRGGSRNLDLNKTDPVTGTRGALFPDPGTRQRLYNRNPNDWGPRLGFAWDLTGHGRTVIRGGYGIFYSVAEANIPADYALNAPFLNTSFFSNSEAGQPPLFDITNPFVGVPSELSFGIFATPQNFPDTYSQAWSFDLQREVIPGTLVFDAAYVGNKGTHLPIQTFVNEAPPGPGEIQPRRPYPGLGDVFYFDNVGNSTYHGLQLKANWRQARGLNFLATYTWAKSIDLHSASIYGEPTAGDVQNNSNLSADKGPSAFDTRHRVTLSYLYELPFGRGKSILNDASGVANALVGGWQINGILTANTGFPFTVFVPGDPLNRGRGSVRADVVPGNPNFQQKIPEQFFDISRFVAPPPYQFGSLGKNTETGPGFFNLDLSVFKGFRLTERAYLDFRFEFFNALNHPNFGQPGRTLGTPTFGVIGSARDGRQIQVAAKITF